MVVRLIKPFGLEALQNDVELVIHLWAVNDLCFNVHGGA